MTGRRSHADPFQFAFQCLAALALLFFLERQPVRFLFEPAAVIAFPRNALAPVQFQNPSGHVVEEITVVRHGDHRALVLLEVLFEPVDALGVEVVGRLVEQQHVGLLEQQAAQGHAAAFSAREVSYKLVGIRTAQRVHRPFERGVQLPAVLVVDLFGQFALAVDEPRHFLVVHRLHEFGIHLFVFLEQCYGCRASFLDHFADGLRVVQLRFLFQIAHRVAGREHDFALIVLVQSGDDFHQRRFSRSVQTDDPDLGAVEKRQVDVVEHFFLVGEGLADPHHGENYFFVCHILVCPG